MARSAIYPPSVQPGIPEEWPLPPSWKWTPLAHVINVVERPANIQDETEYQLVTAKRNRGGIVAREKLLGKEIRTKSQFVVEPGDFVISRRQIIHGACGVVPHSLRGAVVSNEYATLRVRPELELDYLRRLSHTPYFQKTCFQSSMGVDVEKMVFKLERWLNFRLPLPPVEEQLRIGSVMMTADAAVDAAQAVIHQTERVRRGVVEELLQRGMPGRHQRFKVTEVGEAPKSWEVARIGDVLESTTYGISTALNLDSSGVPVLRMGNIQNHRLELADLKYTNLEGLDADAAILRRDDIVFNRTNSAELVGKVAMIDVDRPLSYASYLLRLRTNRRALPRWLHLALSAPRMQATLQSISTRGVSQCNINPSRMRDVKLLVPEVSEQGEIVDVAASLDAAGASAANALESAQRTRDAVAAELLSGRVRVRA
jgi:type I restriction enzyme, S subunit